jgi:hypothetical protein
VRNSVQTAKDGGEKSDHKFKKFLNQLLQKEKIAIVEKQAK